MFRILVAALLAGLVGVSGATGASASYRCSVDRVIRARCCCPIPPRGPGAIVRAACCDIESHEPVAASALVAQEDALVAVPAGCGTAAALSLPQLALARPAARPEGSLDPPIRLLTRALLI